MIRRIYNRLHENAKRIMLMTVVFAAASSLGYVFRSVDFPDTNIVVIYLLAVLIIAWLAHSFVFGFLASVLATFAYNYFFAEPYFTFSVTDKSYITTFVTMTVTALVTSTLTQHAKQSAFVARQKEAESKAIYNLTNRLTDAKDMKDIVEIAVSAIGEGFSCKAVCLCCDINGLPDSRAESDTDGELYDWPVLGRETMLGVIRIPKERALVMSESETRLLRTMIESIAFAMDRFRAAEQRMLFREETIKERYRSNLLRAISHDLRTPLSAVIGTAEMLIGMTEPEDPRYALLTDIRSEADWLHSLVENILNLTRLQDGKLALQKRPEAVEEIIGVVVRHISQRSPAHRIEVCIPDELLFVPMDAKLIEQVLINLLDNAVVHTGSAELIQIIVEPDKKTVRFTVRDEGNGIKETDLPFIFQTFFSAHVKRDAGHGIGLGLAICEAIIKAHGGDIEARNREDKNGAEFIFTLPLGDDDNA